MHFDHIMSTLDGRHLVFTYVGIILIQGGYVGWVAWNWLKLGKGR
jgi:hypothetical protein